MSEICETKPYERKPEASIDLQKGFKIDSAEIGKEVSVTVKGKLCYVSMGKNWQGDSDETIQGHLRIEISSLKFTGANPFEELAKDDD